MLAIGVPAPVAAFGAPAATRFALEGGVVG
jgi:hypothetical protein